MDLHHHDSYTEAHKTEKAITDALTTIEDFRVNNKCINMYAKCKNLSAEEAEKTVGTMKKHLVTASKNIAGGLGSFSKTEVDAHWMRTARELALLVQQVFKKYMDYYDPAAPPPQLETPDWTWIADVDSYLQSLVALREKSVPLAPVVVDEVGPDIGPSRSVADDIRRLVWMALTFWWSVARFWYIPIWKLLCHVLKKFVYCLQGVADLQVVNLSADIGGHYKNSLLATLEFF
jgi:hypothetical protein